MATRTSWTFARRLDPSPPQYRTPGRRLSPTRPISRRWSGRRSSTRSSCGSCSGWIRGETDRSAARGSAVSLGQPPLAIGAMEHPNEHAGGGRDDDAVHLALLHASDQGVERLAGADRRRPRFHHRLHRQIGITVECLAADATQDHTLVVDDDASRLAHHPEAIAHITQPVMQGARWGVSIRHISGAWSGGVGSFRGQTHSEPAIFAWGVAIDAGEPE